MQLSRVLTRWMCGVWLMVIGVQASACGSSATKSQTYKPGLRSGSAGNPATGGSRGTAGSIACISCTDAGNTDAGSTDAGNTDAGNTKPSTSFADVYAILTEGCGGGRSGCHVGGSPGNLALPDVKTAYDALVGVASMKCPEQIRVIPGDAAGSLLVQALEGTATCVAQMPKGRAPLSPDQIATVRSWIDAGATPD